MENKGRADGKQRRENRKQGRRTGNRGRAGGKQRREGREWWKGERRGGQETGQKREAGWAGKKGRNGQEAAKAKIGRGAERESRRAGESKGKEKAERQQKEGAARQKRKTERRERGSSVAKKEKLKGRKGARSGQKTEAGRTGSGRCREPFGNTPFPARRDKKGEGSVKDSSPWSKRALWGYFCTISSSSSNQPAPANLSTMKST